LHSPLSIAQDGDLFKLTALGLKTLLEKNLRQSLTASIFELIAPYQAHAEISLRALPANPRHRCAVEQRLDP
jgi:hypothetical protein